MNRIPGLITAALLGLIGATTAHAAGRIEVSYVNPEQFRDVGFAPAERERTMNTLSDYLKQLARQLPDGQTLRVEVTDIDVAGEPFRWVAPTEFRIANGGADWPYLALRYSLLEDGRTLKSGQAQLKDMAYLNSRRGQVAADTPMYYEKRMLKQWFDETILVRH